MDGIGPARPEFIDEPPRPSVTPPSGSTRFRGGDMALSDGEQRRLDEIARGLTIEDPTFADRITHAGLRRPRLVVAALIFVMGMVALVTGLVITDSVLWFGLVFVVAGLLAMGTGVVIAVRERARR
jgi:hypothetical protein